MLYDVLIAGGGPAGSLCAYLLCQRGYRCAILEKNAECQEKICGGLMPYKAIHLLQQNGLIVHDFPTNEVAIIHHFHSIHNDKQEIFSYRNGKYGIALRRKQIDSYLITRSVQAGAHLYSGCKVSNVTYSGHSVKACGIEGRLLVDATGVFGIGGPSLHLSRRLSFGISSQVSGETLLEADSVYFWYPDNASKDYYWAIPIGPHIWNIGMWFQYPRKTILFEYEAAMKKLQNDCFVSWDTIRKRQGAYCGNAQSLTHSPFPHILIGDAAGTCSFDTGEGIYQALYSAEQSISEIEAFLNS